MFVSPGSLFDVQRVRSLGIRDGDCKKVRPERLPRLSPSIFLSAPPATDEASDKARSKQTKREKRVLCPLMRSFPNWYAFLVDSMLSVVAQMYYFPVCKYTPAPQATTKERKKTLC